MTVEGAAKAQVFGLGESKGLQSTVQVKNSTLLKNFGK
jgi:hypothetical protein